MQLESHSIQHEYKHTMALWIQRPFTWVNALQETWDSCHKMRQVFLYFILWIHEAKWKLSAKEPGIWQSFLEISLEFSSVGMSALFPSSIWYTYEVEATADFSISFAHWIQAIMPIFLALKKSFNQSRYCFKESWILDAFKPLWISSLFTWRGFCKVGKFLKKTKKYFQS